MKSVQIRSFFWSVFSCIRIEYGDLQSPYSDRIQENTDQKKLRIWTLFTKCEVDFEHLETCILNNTPLVKTVDFSVSEYDLFAYDVSFLMALTGWKPFY